MTKEKKGNVFVAPVQVQTTEILGCVFGYRELNAGKRNEIVEKHTKINTQTGDGSQDTTKILQEIMACMFVEVPDTLKDEFKKEHGKGWKGTSEDFGMLYPGVQDELSKFITGKLGVSAEDGNF